MRRSFLSQHLDIKLFNGNAQNDSITLGLSRPPCARCCVNVEGSGAPGGTTLLSAWVASSTRGWVLAPCPMCTGAGCVGGGHTKGFLGMDGDAQLRDCFNLGACLRFNWPWC